MPPKKSRATKSCLNYQSLLYYIKYDAYPPEVKTAREKRNIRKRAKSFRLEQLPEGDKLYFILTDEENVKHEKECVYKFEDQRRAFDEFHITPTGHHLGRDKLLTKISEKYYWQGICQGIREFIKACPECRQKLENVNRNSMDLSTSSVEHISTKLESDLDMEVEHDISSVSFSDSWITSDQQSIEPRHFWDIVEVKLLGPYNCSGRMKHVMVFMDVFSLWPEAAIVESMSTTVVTHVLINLICRFGVMNKLLLRNDTKDLDNLITPRADILLASDIDIQIIYGATSNTDVWSEIESTMNHFVVNNADWRNCLSFALLPHRISRGRNTEYSPSFLTYGREIKLPPLLSHQPSAEYLQTGDGYLSIYRKIETINTLMNIYKGYCGNFNISQESDVIKAPSRILSTKPAQGKSCTETCEPLLNPETTEHETQNNDGVNTSNSDTGSVSVLSDDDNEDVSVAGVEVKQEVISGDEEETSPKMTIKRKRWSKTHRTSMDYSSNNAGDISSEELHKYEKLLQINDNNEEETLMNSDDIDSHYETLLMYLKHKKYAPCVMNEHIKRNIRKMSESHYIEDDILYHKWKTRDRMVPLRFDERYYILESYHVDSSGKHIGFRQMNDRLNKFYWKSMVADSEAYVRTCVHCNQTKSMNNENFPDYFYDDTDEMRARLAEENYSLLVKYLQKGRLVQTVQPNKSKLIILLANWFIMKDGQVFYKRPDRQFSVCLEIASRAQRNAIKDAHVNQGYTHHIGQTGTLQNLSEKYIWYGMKDSCEDFVTSCCNLPKPPGVKRNSTLKRFDLQLRISAFKKIREMQENSDTVQTIQQAKNKVFKKFGIEQEQESQSESIVSDKNESLKNPQEEKSQNNDEKHTSETNEEVENDIDLKKSVSNKDDKKEDVTLGSQAICSDDGGIQTIISNESVDHQMKRNVQKSDDLQQAEQLVSDQNGKRGGQVMDLEQPEMNISTNTEQEIVIEIHQVDTDSHVTSGERSKTVIISADKSGYHIVDPEKNCSSQQQSESHVQIKQGQIAESTGEKIYAEKRLSDLPNEDLTQLSHISEAEETNFLQQTSTRAVESQLIQTDYDCTTSDEATLSAVRSILPADDNVEEDDEETESEKDSDENSDKDPNWSPQQMVKSQKQLKPEVIEPNLGPTKKRYDKKASFRCKQCGKFIKGIVRYKTHLYEHTGVKPFACEYCPKRFTTLKTKKIHMMRHTGKNEFLCYLCGKGFSTSSSLKSHIRVHEKGGNNMVKCDQCPRVFRTKNRYEKHKKFKHPYQPEEYRCEECSKDFTTKRSLIRHNKSQHEKIKTHMCEVCGKGFFRKEYLKSHLTTHEGGKLERPYDPGLVRGTSIHLIPGGNKDIKYEIPINQTSVAVPITVQYSASETSADCTIPLTESHVALPSTTVENQMTVESSYYITNADDDSQVTHMLVYEQPAVQYEIECGSSNEQMDAEALSAINMLAQASINQGY